NIEQRESPTRRRVGRAARKSHLRCLWLGRCAHIEIGALRARITHRLHRRKHEICEYVPSRIIHAYENIQAEIIGWRKNAAHDIHPRASLETVGAFEDTAHPGNTQRRLTGSL